MRLRPLLVGATPNPRSNSPTALAGRCTGFLAMISGLSYDVITEDFERVNLVPEVVFGNWPARMARENATKMSATRCQYRDVLLLGKDVGNAFGLKCSFFEEVDVGCGDAFHSYLIPHPSGLCRTWNNPVSRAIGGKLIREVHARWRDAR